MHAVLICLLLLLLLILCYGMFDLLTLLQFVMVHTAERLGDARAGKKPSFLKKMFSFLSFFYVFLVSENKDDQIKISTQKEHPLGLHNFPCHKTHKSQLKYEIEHEIYITAQKIKSLKT